MIKIVVVFILLWVLVYLMLDRFNEMKKYERWNTFKNIIFALFVAAITCFILIVWVVLF